MPVLGNCCFFLDLKVGTMIIGVITLISDIFQTLGMGVALISIQFIQNTFQAIGTQLQAESKNEFERQAHGTINDWIQANIQMVKILAYFLLALSLALMVVDSMLIHGVKNNRRGLLFPWIILNGIKGGLLLIGAIALFATFGGQFEQIIYTGLSFFVGTGLEIYFLLVVISQYEAMGIINMHDDMSMKP